MRLTSEEVSAIKAAAIEVFGENVVVRLFGSRVDDSKRGGDVDLHVELDDRRQRGQHDGRFMNMLWQAIGEREIDVVYAVRGDRLTSIDRKAIEQGIAL